MKSICWREIFFSFRGRKSVRVYVLRISHEYVFTLVADLLKYLLKFSKAYDTEIHNMPVIQR